MKGLELPVSAVVIIAVVLLVLVVVSAFFLSQSGSQFSTIEQQGEFSRLCTQMECSLEQVGKIADDSEFFRACKALYGETMSKYDCLRACGCKSLPNSFQETESDIYDDITALINDAENLDTREIT
jgi:hypothetical protein